MNDAHLERIARAEMPMVRVGDPVPSSAVETKLRRAWVRYRDELLAEVRRLQAENADLVEELDDVRRDFERYSRAAGGTL